MKRILEKYSEILTGVLWLLFVVSIPFWLNGFSDIKTNPELLRGFGLFVLGIGVAPLGLYLAYNRTKSSRDQTESLRAQAETEKEKNVTDAFAKSVELLGNESIAVRQGGIYALGRIAGDNPELHPMIMDIVASYIRQQSRDRFNSRLQKEGDGYKDKLIEEFNSKPVSMDIEAAVAVIRQRNTKNDKPSEESRYSLDLSNAYIFNAYFNDTKLTEVNFSDSVMMDCIFDKTDLSESNFKASILKGSSFQNCDLQGANLQGANLRGAELEQDQVNSVKDSTDAILPEGLHHPIAAS